MKLDEAQKAYKRASIDLAQTEEAMADARADLYEAQKEDYRILLAENARLKALKLEGNS